MLHDPIRAQVRAPVLLALGAVYVIWGSTYLGIRIALESYPPFVMGAIRFLLAGGALYAWLRARGAPPESAHRGRTAHQSPARSTALRSN
jgi:drug/metabolite transporter (DMT)-like permease